MKNRSFLIMPLLSFLVLAAHSLRASDYMLMAFWLALMLLVFIIKKASIRIFCSGALSAGVVIWLENAWNITRVRMIMDAPYTRLLLILGGVLIIMVLGVYYLYKSGRNEDRLDNYAQN